MISSRFHFRRLLFPVLTGLVFGVVSGIAQDAAEMREFTVIPDRFTQRQDELGFFWQVDQYGALTSGDTQYLASGLRLGANGTDFAPAKATLRDDSATNGVVDLILTETRKDIEIKRLIWFDQSRSGVRVLDTVTNKTGSAITIPVELRSTHPFAWQNLYGSQGDLLERDPDLTLGERDTGVTVKFSQSDGRQDMLYLTSGEKSGQRPSITSSSNQRELVFRYELKIAAGKSASLVHWALQRNLTGPENAGVEWNPFFQRRRLINSRVDADVAGTVANFDTSSFPTGGRAPTQLQSLTRLNDLTDRIGLHRREEDILWVSTTNQLAGTINPQAVLTVESPFAGDGKFSIAKVAAVSGGGGVGRVPKLYLRDGRVFAGEISAENLSLTIGEDSNVDDLDPKEINLLLCALAPEDGVPPPGTTGFIQLRSGSVLAVKGPEDLKIATVNPWGSEELGLEGIEELAYVSRPTPKFRLVRADGSRISVFLPVAILNVELSDGEAVDLPSSLIENIWKAGMGSLSTGLIEDFWLEIAEIPSGFKPASGFLLQGNNLVAGTFDDKTITVLDGQSTVDISAAEVESIQKILESGTAAAPVFEIELKNGDILKGRIQGSDLSIRHGEKVWNVPVPHLLAFWAK